VRVFDPYEMETTSCHTLQERQQQYHPKNPAPNKPTTRCWNSASKKAFAAAMSSTSPWKFAKRIVPSLWPLPEKSKRRVFRPAAARACGYGCVCGDGSRCWLHHQASCFELSHPFDPPDRSPKRPLSAHPHLCKLRQRHVVLRSCVPVLQDRAARSGLGTDARQGAHKAQAVLVVEQNGNSFGPGSGSGSGDTIGRCTRRHCSEVASAANVAG